MGMDKRRRVGGDKGGGEGEGRVGDRVSRVPAVTVTVKVKVKVRRAPMMCRAFGDFWTGSGSASVPAGLR